MKFGRYKSKNRLTFKRNVIEKIDDDGFYINEIASLGVFKISKADFYKYFDNVVASVSWEKGLYNYPAFPQWATRFLSSKTDSN